MDIPIDLPLPGQLGVLVREYAPRYDGAEDEMDEGVPKKRADNFMDMYGKSREVDEICERLYSFTEPWQWWDGKWILHGGVG